MGAVPSAIKQRTLILSAGRGQRSWSMNDEAVNDERKLATQRQRRAGLKAVCKTGYGRDLPKEVDSALQRIWELGNVGEGVRDETLGRVYTMISKGLASMTTADVIRLGNMNDKQIREAAPRLAQGKAL